MTADQAKMVTEFLTTRKDARITEGVMKAGTPERLARGQSLYREHGCQNCHFTPAASPKGYVGGTSGTSAELRKTISEGRPGTAMTGYEGAFEESQWSDLIAYIRSLKS